MVIRGSCDATLNPGDSVPSAVAAIPRPTRHAKETNRSKLPKVRKLCKLCRLCKLRDVGICRAVPHQAMCTYQFDVESKLRCLQDMPNQE